MNNSEFKETSGQEPEVGPVSEAVYQDRDLEDIPAASLEAEDSTTPHTDGQKPDAGDDEMSEADPKRWDTPQRSKAGEGPEEKAKKPKVDGDQKEGKKECGKYQPKLRYGKPDKNGKPDKKRIQVKLTEDGIVQVNVHNREDPLVKKARDDWKFLSDPEKLGKLAGIDWWVAREELIRGWDRDVDRALRKEGGFLDMGAVFLDYAVNSAPNEESPEKLRLGMEATVGYMVRVRGRLDGKRQELLKKLNAGIPRDSDETILRRLGATDPEKRIAEYKAAKKQKSQEFDYAKSVLEAVAGANAAAAERVRNELGREHPQTILEDTQAERLFPLLSQLLDERRLEELQAGDLTVEELRLRLREWAGEINEKLLIPYSEN